mmetsp:Transcript_21772/g.43271  ORF Transcript_21772/g.43271 Transcript_21772/m.43271 type:complete len:119 (-) Transcript_21772:1178-1534(-)
MLTHTGRTGRFSGLTPCSVTRAAPATRRLISLREKGGRPRRSSSNPFPPNLGALECLPVQNPYESSPASGQEHIDPLWRGGKAERGPGAHERENDNIAFLSLKSVDSPYRNSGGQAAL